MKLCEIEKKYKEYLGKQEPPTQSKDKEQVWSQVQNKMQRPKRLYPVWYLAAASITLIMLSSFALYQLYLKNQTIARLQAALEEVNGQQQVMANNNRQLKGELEEAMNRPLPVDTVFITKVVYQEPEKRGQVDAEITETVSPLESVPVEQDQEMPVLANLQSEVESLEIEYGEKTGEGITPWRFTVKYH